jgi:cell division protein FtsI (penicillin-binding protein 3)
MSNPYDRLSEQKLPSRIAESVRLEGARKQAVETGRTRLVVVAAVFACAFLVLAGRLVHLSSIGEGGSTSLANEGSGGLGLARAEILDRNGVLLAIDLGTASLYADPHRVLDAAEAANQISRVLPDIDRSELFSKLTTSKRFVWVKRHLTPRQQYAVNALGLPGIAFLEEQKRVYPQGNLVAHVVGYTGVDNRGLAGIEKHLDQRLGTAARVGSAQPPLRLSLDVRVQHVLRSQLASAMETYQAKGAVGVILDANDGQIVASVSLPDFDPHRIDQMPEENKFNRASLGVYEMGSTFKIFTVAMALELGTADLTDSYDARKPIRVARFMIRDDHAKERWLSVPEVFIYSSNIGAAKMALDVGAERQQAFLKQIGLLQRAPLEISEVGQPISPNPWRKISTMTVAFGYGIAVSPIQMASAVASLVNGGTRVVPTFVRSRDREHAVSERVVSERTSRAIRQLMRLNVVEGTGTKADVPGYLVGGKTGTAEKVGAQGYDRRALRSSFVGIFPTSAPRYVVLVMLDEPKGTKETFGFATAGWTAAPIVGQVIERASPLLGVEIDGDEKGQTAQHVGVSRKGRLLASF